MTPLPFRCPHCTITLGGLTRKQDHRGRPTARLKMNQNVEQVGRILFKGNYAECRCGEKVRVPDGVTIEFR